MVNKVEVGARSKSSKTKYAILHGLWTVAVFAVVTFVAGAVGVIVDGKQSPGQVDVPILLAAIIGYLIIVPVLIGLPSKFRHRAMTPHDLGVDRVPKTSDIYWGLAGFVVIIALSFIVSTIFKALGVPVSSPQIDPNRLSGEGMFVVLLLTVAVAPVVEEFVFRGYLYGGLRKYGIPIGVAMVETGALFAIFHGPSVAIVAGAFAMSVCSTVLREKTSAVWSAMIAHALNNATVFILLVIGVSL